MDASYTMVHVCWASKSQPVFGSDVAVYASVLCCCAICWPAVFDCCLLCSALTPLNTWTHFPEHVKADMCSAMLLQLQGTQVLVSIAYPGDINTPGYAKENQAKVSVTI